jgi:hypothetical protein
LHIYPGWYQQRISKFIRTFVPRRTFSRKKFGASSLLLLATVASAQENLQKGAVASDVRKSFTTVKTNPITSVKNQSRSGTYWDFATLGFFESEILRKTGRTYDLCEMFVVSKDYMDNATHYVRMHGYSQISEGGSADGVRPTQQLRQEQWDDWRFTYDHVILHILS